MSMSNIETEIKVLGVDPEEIRSKAAKMEVGLKSRNQRDFVVLLSSKEVMRAREVNGRVKLTYKNRLDDRKFKVAREVDLTVSDFDSACKILTRLCRGLKHFQFTKKREVFTLNGASCELVQLDPLDWYLEIEGEEDAILQNIEELGLEDHEHSSKGIPDLLKSAGVYPEVIE